MWEGPVSNKQKRGETPKPASPPVESEEVVLAKLQNTHAWIVTVRYVLMILAFGVVLWMATPLAREIAGQDTNFNVKVTMGLTATLTLTTAAGYGYALNQRRRANHLDRRNKQLERQVEELQNKLDHLE